MANSVYCRASPSISAHICIAKCKKIIIIKIAIHRARIMDNGQSVISVIVPVTVLTRFVQCKQQILINHDRPACWLKTGSGVGALY